ncbi:MAG TPA: hypothetical protein DCS28_04085 [Candidatus Moranbacteria bacterium]|nr:hypothetical protein [Candidatus Moranbacteria bacterium]HAT75188.1 hypothetical protein [Candidatus Moranbacteria bacterium]
MSKIICIGSACKDVFFPTAEGKIVETPEDILSKQKIEFELGAKYKIEDRFEALGGCAANVAVGLARLGISTECYAHIGNDYIADWILNELQKNKVETNLISKDKNFTSDMSAIVVDKKTGERVIFSNQKANGNLKIIPEKIEGAEWIFIGDLHGNWQRHLDLIFNVAQKHKIKLAYNPRQINIHDDSKKVIEKIVGTEILFVNKDEAIEIILSVNNKKIDDEKYLLQELKNLGAKIVVITDGARGAWANDGEKTFFASGLKVSAVDSTGAGDAFCSGFLGARIKGKNLEECLKWGIINSSNEVQFYGAVDGLLNEDEIIKLVDGIKVEKVVI